MYVNVSQLWCYVDRSSNWVACEAECSQIMFCRLRQSPAKQQRKKDIYILKPQEGYLSKAQIHYFIVRLMFWLPTLLFTSLLSLYPALLVSSHEET